jgi:hypothetical protein
MAFHSVAGAADDQQFVSTHRAVAGHVHGQFFMLSATQRVQVMLHGQAGGTHLGQEQSTRLGIGVCKAGVDSGGGVGRGGGDAHAAPLPSHCCTSFTQKLAPRGISASLKS